MLYIGQSNQSPHSEEGQARLRAADGYLYLGLREEALRELDLMPAADAITPEADLARVRVLMHLQRWEEALEIAQHGIDSHPHRDEFYTQTAFALEQLGRANEIPRALNRAAPLMIKTGILHYNLACYCARIGSQESARLWIAEAIRRNPAMERNVGQDPDLQVIAL